MHIICAEGSYPNHPSPITLEIKFRIPGSVTPAVTQR